MRKRDLTGLTETVTLVILRDSRGTPLLSLWPTMCNIS